MQIANAAGGKRLRAVFRPLGGLDLAAPPGAADDGALTDACNVWDDGASLRLRPGLKRWLGQEYGDVLCVYPPDGRRVLILRVVQNGVEQTAVYGFYIVTQRALLYCDGESIVRVPSFASYGDGKWMLDYQDYNFEDVCVVPAARMAKSGTAGTRVTTAQGSAVYLFGGGHFLTVTPDVFQWPLDSSSPALAGVFAGERVPYVPTIRTGTPPAGGGTQGEARNLLTPKVTQAFTTDAAASVYRLADMALDDGQVDAVLTNAAGQSVAFSFPADVTTATAGGITAALDRAAGSISFSAPLGAAAANNLLVTYCKTVCENPIPYCSVAAWYGGPDTQGAGSRLFVGGWADAPHTAYYSAADDPDYFPADNALPIGDPADPITAFGGQYDVLVVFKQGSIYSVDADTAGRYTVKPVHSAIGCDMPGSVASVNNMLVWGTRAGGMFRLHSTQIRNERAVQPVGAPVLPLWKTLATADLAQAGGLCDGRCYYLFAGEDVLVWHIESLKSDGTGGAFYRWRLPQSFYIPLLVDGCLWVANGQDFYRFDETAVMDENGWFPAWLQTKAFDFNLPERWKTMTGLWADFAPGASLLLLRVCGQTRRLFVPARGGMADCGAGGSDTAFCLRFERPPNAATPLALRRVVLEATAGAALAGAETERPRGKEQNGTDTGNGGIASG